MSAAPPETFKELAPQIDRWFAGLDDELSPPTLDSIETDLVTAPHGTWDYNLKAQQASIPILAALVEVQKVRVLTRIADALPKTW